MPRGGPSAWLAPGLQADYVSITFSLAGLFFVFLESATDHPFVVLQRLTLTTVVALSTANSTVRILPRPFGLTISNRHQWGSAVQLTGCWGIPRFTGATSEERESTEPDTPGRHLIL